MKKNFEQCLEWLLVHEGGYVDHPSDPGGATNLGVTIHTAKRLGLDVDGDGDVDKDDVRLFDYEIVAPVYKAQYWDKVRGDDLPSGVDWAVCDWGVNAGPPRAAKGLQRVVGATADGVIGPMTLRSANNHEPQDIIRAMQSQRQHFYESLQTFSTFGRGWTRRNEETTEQALSLWKSK